MRGHSLKLNEKRSWLDLRWHVLREVAACRYALYTVHAEVCAEPAVHRLQMEPALYTFGTGLCLVHEKLKIEDIRVTTDIPVVSTPESVTCWWYLVCHMGKQIFCMSVYSTFCCCVRLNSCHAPVCVILRETHVWCWWCVYWPGPWIFVWFRMMLINKVGLCLGERN